METEIADELDLGQDDQTDLVSGTGIASGNASESGDFKERLRALGATEEDLSHFDTQFVPKPEFTRMRQQDKATLNQLNARLAQLEGHQTTAAQATQQVDMQSQLFDKYGIDPDSHGDFRNLLSEFGELTTRRAVEGTLQYLNPIIQGVTQDHQLRYLEQRRQELAKSYGKDFESLWPDVQQQTLQLTAQSGQQVDPEWVLLKAHSDKARILIAKEENRKARQQREKTKQTATEGFTQTRRTSAPGASSGDEGAGSKPKIPTAAEIVAAIEADDRRRRGG